MMETGRKMSNTSCKGRMEGGWGGGGFKANVFFQARVPRYFLTNRRTLKIKIPPR